ncbi:helix-turn-helix domain-containing protein [Photorhabdus sp. APURE]|uniref:helix-turn-helix domain-containing protein n=1 Tax=Photorhabdus aballayi TaxID=2991723 RepID=UPI00223E3702|nr:helix-turn-helix transcriptional regulator [Photorhabdus aballayi]MCW7550750.1 helix-turn-helix domain-containing protein [Photorhabdus aballayi]
MRQEIAIEMSEKEKCTSSDNTCNEITEFKDRLRQAIGDESVNSFANRCGIPESSLRNYLSGRIEPSLSKLVVFAEKSGVTVGWLAIGDTAVTEEQENAWLMLLHRMTLNERNVIIDKIFRLGINALLKTLKEDIQQPES